ncbi:MAG: hypothetical protein AB7O48_15180 [Cyclobacteriaceae bacterium]
MKKRSIRIHLVHLLVFFLSIGSLLGQSDTVSTDVSKRKWQLRGYVKDMVTLNVASDSTTVDNLIHNRLNFKWYPTSNFNVYLELRNRVFAGDLVKSVPGYENLVDGNNDFFDLSVQKKSGRSVIFQSMIDRAYIEWYNDKWEVRAGRQRINWGVNLVWNPNDLFNVYSFFDFDYEERPGSDAIRIKRYTGFASSVELAATLNDDFDKTVIAGMWKVNRWGYDFQFLGGKAREDITLGMGWAGNINKAGFKGELTWFEPYKDNSNSSALLASISVDYSFENSLYLNGSLLFNSDGSDTQFLNSSGFGNSGQLTVRNLSPFKYSTFFQTSYKFHPLITGGLAIIYYPSSRNALFLNPNATFSLKPNLDLDLIGQIYYDKLLGDYQALAKLGYVRLKWSF